METKRRKSGAGIAAVLLIALAEAAFKDGGARTGISVLYVLIVAGIVYAVVWAARRGRRNARPSPAGPLPKVNPPESVRRPAAPPRSAERPVSPVYRADGASDEEQWRSLLEAGLITREEYRERLGGMGRG